MKHIPYFLENASFGRLGQFHLNIQCSDGLIPQLDVQLKRPLERNNHNVYEKTFREVTITSVFINHTNRTNEMSRFLADQ